MRLRRVSIGLLVGVSLFMFGCSKDNDTTNESSKTETENTIVNKGEKDTEESSPQDLEGKLSEASYSSELNPIERTMDESLDYVKSILPEGIQETSRNLESEVGVTEVIYEVDDLAFEVRYMHPYKESGGMVYEYNLDKTSGIYMRVKS